MRCVTVEDMMRARDERAERQRTLLRRHRAPLLSLTMNIAGPVKRTPLIERGHRLAKNRILSVLSGLRAPVLEAIETIADTGAEWVCAVRADALTLKKHMAALEDMDAFGRLADIDVLREDGRKVGRTQLGLPARRCLLCGEMAAVCASSRRHPYPALFERAEQIIRDALCAEACGRIAFLAEKSLLFEAALTPKPGLVDAANAGAHRDMDLNTLLSSACALRPYFERCARAGYSEEGPLMDRLRPLGLLAEQAMLDATGGVNTHKGAIYALGIACAAAGETAAGAAGDLFDACARIAQGETAALSETAPRTNGETQFALHRAGGARAEAEQGFPSVRSIALPCLADALNAGLSFREAAIRALIALIAHVDDTNMMKRAGYARAKEIQAAVRKRLPLSLCEVEALDRAFIRENLSPGGCADLLALTLFAHWLGADFGP